MLAKSVIISSLDSRNLALFIYLCSIQSTSNLVERMILWKYFYKDIWIWVMMEWRVCIALTINSYKSYLEYKKQLIKRMR